MFWVYAIYNQLSDKIYIGQTKDPAKRLSEHNQKHGNHYTAKFEGEWKLVYKESVSTRLEAVKRERQLKSQKGREFIHNFLKDFDSMG